MIINQTSKLQVMHQQRDDNFPGPDELARIMNRPESDQWSNECGDFFEVHGRLGNE